MGRQRAVRASAFLLLLLFLFQFLPWLARTAAAAAGPESLPREGQATVTAVADGETVAIGPSSREVKLAGLQAPLLLPAEDGPSWPLARESREALERLVRHRVVTLHRSGDGGSEDRYGRLLAHLVRDDGLWIQGEMLRQGMARVLTLPGNAALAPEMLALEHEARTARRGLWHHPFYAVRDPDVLARTPRLRERGTFQVVEGRVVAAAVVQGHGYLNFGPDLKTDFTIHIGPRVLKPLRKRHPDLRVLEGQIVRVRGIIGLHNGPEVDLSHPEALETPETLPAEQPQKPDGDDG